MPEPKFAFLILLISSCSFNKKIIDTPSPQESTNGIIVKVEKNERGVIFRRFANGIDTSKVYLPGEYRINPYDRFIKYNIDLKVEDDYFEVKTISGNKITLNLQYSYSIVPEKVALMEYYIGHNYPESIVKAIIQFSIEKYMGEVVNPLFDSNSQKHMEESLYSIAKEKMIERYVNLYGLKILEIKTD